MEKCDYLYGKYSEEVFSIKFTKTRGESEVLTIRKAKAEDIDFIMQIYARARKFMAKTGNPNQWGDSKPYREWIENDIEVGNCYVCIEQVIDKKIIDEIWEANSVPEKEIIAAVFYFAIEEDPTYKVIYEGEWLNHKPYGVVHRIASAGTVKGAGEYCLKWAIDQCRNLRIDTHEDNVVMQTLLKKLEFQYCGVIHLTDGEPRLAFQYENK